MTLQIVDFVYQFLVLKCGAI